MIDTNPENLEFVSTDKYAAISIDMATPIPGLADVIYYFCRRCGVHFHAIRSVAYRGVWDRERMRTLKVRCPSLICIYRETSKV